MNATIDFTTPSLTEQNNAIITEALNSILAEAVEHFNQKRSCRRVDDERYFFKKSEVDAVLSKLLHPEWVKVKIEYDVDGVTPFCYTMDYKVIHRATRNKKNPQIKTINENTEEV